MSREKKIQFNVNEKEYERLKSHAESEGLSMAEVLRDYIKTLTLHPTTEVRGLCARLL
ncbi:ribbon-helix-helix protein, CopG family [Planktothrix prolifica]|jgi:hypothetical protein|uniref:ribbon-helix-helix protein, CopG family n=1 Tax=Planktothrix prolifica TaxID=54307 RepID=UPI00091A74C2|nr:ribbon-helix-helix protein, CopG family [Planktothrix prolifica]CAD5913089.1 hypothetical protein NO108_00540 [Planktothrix rubescens]CAD5954025.1 hypothetical protein PCC7821_02721 [Planktothrix rubescens NIVA-CYA 18]